MSAVDIRPARFVFPAQVRVGNVGQVTAAITAGRRIDRARVGVERANERSRLIWEFTSICRTVVVRVGLIDGRSDGVEARERQARGGVVIASAGNQSRQSGLRRQVVFGVVVLEAIRVADVGDRQPRSWRRADAVCRGSTGSWPAVCSPDCPAREAGWVNRQNSRCSGSQCELGLSISTGEGVLSWKLKGIFGPALYMSLP